MSKEHQDLWWRGMVAKYGSKEAVIKMYSEKAKIDGFQPGNVPLNKIQDEFSDLPISRQQKYLLRKKNEKD